MGLRNSDQNYTGLVQKYVGTAYDKVASVADHITDVTLVAGSIDDGTFQYVVDNMDSIIRVVADINEFNNLYYGVLPVEPTTDPSGEPITDGDLYYNITEEQLYVYGNGKWLPVGAIETTTEYIKVTTDMLPGGVGTIGLIPLTKPYSPAQNNLLVHVRTVADGVTKYHWSTTTDGLTGTYVETDGTTLTFNAGELAEDDELVVIVGVEVATVQHMIDVDTGIHNVAGPNEQLIKLPASVDEPAGMTYVPGDHNLEVYLKSDQHSRELQIVGIDYLEIDPNYIQFINPLPDYSEVYFRKGQIISTLPQIPRTLMMDKKPTEVLYQEGQFWYNTDTGRLSILYKDIDTLQWVDVSEEHTVIQQPGHVAPPAPAPVLVNSTVFQKEYPDPANFHEGAFWFNTSTGVLSILYTDEDEAGNGVSAQWVKVSTQ